MLSSASGKKPRSVIFRFVCRAVNLTLVNRSEATAEIIADIFKIFTPRQQKWLIRIILKGQSFAHYFVTVS